MVSKQLATARFPSRLGGVLPQRVDALEFLSFSVPTMAQFSELLPFFFFSLPLALLECSSRSDRRPRSFVSFIRLHDGWAVHAFLKKTS